MTPLRILWSRALDLVLRRRRDDRLSDELQAHLDLLTDEHIARGLSPDDARLAARKSFGGVDQVKAHYRGQRGLPILDALLQDVGFAIRRLARERGFALTAVAVLALGIGVNNMFFTQIYGFKFRGLPIEHASRVLFISTFDDRVPDRPVSLPDLEDLRVHQRSFTGLAAYVNGVVTVGDAGRAPDRFDAAYVSSNAFSQLGVAPLMGRLPAPDEDRPGAAPVVVLGVTVWRSRYAGDPAMIGREIRVNGSPATIVGIVADRSGFPGRAVVWLPLGQLAGLGGQARDARTLRVFGRLRDGVTESDARADVQSIFGRLETMFPQTHRNLRARVVPINERLLGNLDGWMPFITAGLIVILVSCANVANLMIAHALHRAPEIAIRTSLGASRVRIVRQLLVEAAVLAAIGGLGGGVLSLVGTRLVLSVIPGNILAYWTEFSMDTGVFAALVVVSFATVFIFGLIPAIQASRTDVNRTLKDGGRGSTGNRGTRAWTAAFLTAELALATVLLAQVGLATVASRQGVSTDRALETTAVMTSAITLPAAAYPGPAERTEFFRQLDERLLALPEITAASRATVLPMSGAEQRRLDVAGREPALGEATPEVAVVDIAPGYFKTLALPLIRGRDFVDTDGLPGSSTAIINERFAEVFFAHEDPLIARVALTPSSAPAGTQPQWLTIVGVSPSIRQRAVRDPVPVVYLPLRGAAPATVTLMVRHTTDPPAMANVLRREVLAVDADVPLYRMQTLAGAVGEAQWNSRLSNHLALIVTLLSILLATVGLYAVTTHGITLKTREIGLRMALGARSAQVVRLILRGVRLPLGLGFALGAAGSLAWDRAVSSGLVNTYAGAPRTLAAIGAFMIVVVCVACLVPLRRATRMNPISALRHE